MAMKDQDWKGIDFLLKKVNLRKFLWIWSYYYLFYIIINKNWHKNRINFL